MAPASSGSSSQQARWSSAPRSPASKEVISCRSAAAAPRMPRPCRRMYPRAALRSSDRATRVRCVEAAGAQVRISSSYSRTAHWSAFFVPCCSHQPVMPAPESGSEISSTWMRAMPPAFASEARARPQPCTRRACSSGERSTYAGWRTRATAVRVPSCGSWTMAVPVSASMWKRRAAASPGRAMVPAGRGASGRTRCRVWPRRRRHAKWPAVGSVSMAGRPSHGAKANVRDVTQRGAESATPAASKREQHRGDGGDGQGHAGQSRCREAQQDSPTGKPSEPDGVCGRCCISHGSAFPVVG